MRTRDIKARAEELAEGYEDAYNEAFNKEFMDMFFNNITSGHYVKEQIFVPCDVITEDDVQGFLDSFTFPDEGDWAFDQVQSELDDIGDQKYEQMRDERMGL